MKRLLVMAALMGALDCVWAADAPESYNQLPTDVYIPKGFDDNDSNVQIVIEGVFPTSCYKLGLLESQVDQDNKVVVISNGVLQYTSGMCLQVISTYPRVIDLGLLAKGNYEIYFLDSKNQLHKKGQLLVGEAKSLDPDDYLYAPVRNLQFTRATALEPAKVVLQGVFQNSCLKMKKAIVKSDGNVVTIQPVAEMVGETCAQVESDFSYTVELPSIQPGRKLIHVRALKGDAVNLVVRF